MELREEGDGFGDAVGEDTENAKGHEGQSTILQNWTKKRRGGKKKDPYKGKGSCG